LRFPFRHSKESAMLHYSGITTIQRSLVVFGLLLATSVIASLQLPVARAQDPAQAGTNAVPRRPGACRFTSFNQLEPNGGNWKTWVIASPKDFVPGAPPYAPEEIAELIQLQQTNDAAARANVTYWNAGGPSYRWNEIFIAQTVRAATNPQRIGRAQALLNVAIYDALVAAWYAKYLHERPRPAECTPGLTTLIPTPESPSYPSAYAVAAGAASTVLAYLYPTEAASFNSQAELAALSRLQAGVNYRSDVVAGLALGKSIGALVVARGQNDGSSAVFTGTIPTGACNWKGTNPQEPLAGTWKTWVVASGSEFRPGPPPPCNAGSVQFERDLAEVKNHPRLIPATAASFPTTRLAAYWQGNVQVIWNDILSRKIFEHGLDANPLRAARAWALFSVAGYDAIVSVFDAKYAYWYIRPSQHDPTILTLFPVPNHPSYPSAHAIYDGSYAEVLTYLFPQDEAAFRAPAAEAGLSRIWAGIHYRFDVEASIDLAAKVGKKVIEYAKTDGSQ
jgi:membrane-associated phospholipid phosphatase